MLETALLAIAVVVVVLVVTPLDIIFLLERREAFRAELDLRWMFFRWTTPFGQGEARRKKRKERRKSARNLPGQLRAVWNVPGKRATVGRFLRRLGRSVRLVHFVAEVRFGTGDPADTGRIWGIVAPALVWIPHRPAFQFSAEPAFTEAGITGFAKGEVRLYPARVVWALLALLSPVTLRLAWAFVRSQRKGAR